LEQCTYAGSFTVFHCVTGVDFNVLKSPITYVYIVHKSQKKNYIYLLFIFFNFKFELFLYVIWGWNFVRKVFCRIGDSQNRFLVLELYSETRGSLVPTQRKFSLSKYLYLICKINDGGRVQKNFKI
jgi:hypothetical protein